MYRRTDEISGLAQELEAELGDSVVDFGTLGQNQSLEDAPVVKLLQSVFEDAVQIRASDIHIEPQETRLQIRFRIDGVLHMQTEADSKIAGALALRLKLMSGLDISEKRLPQDGRFNVKLKNQAIDVRISTMPTQYGESVVMRLLSQSGGIPTLDRLGFPPEMLKRFRALFTQPQGMVLVTGPTGSGKTTTLYSVLSELNSVDTKIITVEDPVEYRLPGINQVQVNEKIELSFSRVLRASLRQDPDIMLIGEMRDQETAQIAMRAAITGHMVLSTLHTNDAISTPIRLLDMGVPAYMVAMSVRAVLAQRLVRMVCESCSGSYTPLPSELTWLSLEIGAEAQKRAYVHGRGCGNCNGTGFQGRVGVYEMMEMTPTLAEAVNHSDPNHFIKIARSQMAGWSLRRHAVALAANGKTTIAEAMRVSNTVED
jgi:MSHA biogenesis protein MshE